MTTPIYAQRKLIALPFPPGVDAGFGNWLAGFTDGEGCFQISRKNDRAYCCRFTIELRSDDSAILYECQSRTGIGTIRSRTHSPNQYSPTRSPAKPQTCWTVARHQHVDVLVAIFKRYPLRAKKARDFEIWCRAVVEWKRIGRHRGGPGRWNGPIDQTAMAVLNSELQATRQWKEAPCPN